VRFFGFDSSLLLGKGPNATRDSLFLLGESLDVATIANSACGYLRLEHVLTTEHGGRFSAEINHSLSPPGRGRSRDPEPRS
jgi:hypothetical protein